MALLTAVYPKQDCAQVAGANHASLRKAYLADTLSDLPATFPKGSTAIVVDTAKFYIAFADNTWTEFTGGGGGGADIVTDPILAICTE